MKINFKLLVATLAVSSAAIAGTPAAADKAADQASDTAKAADQATAGNAVTGKVTWIDSEKSTFKVTQTSRGVDGKEVATETQLWWSPTTSMAWKDEKSTAGMRSDLKVGAEVTVKTQLNNEGNPVASEIWFHKPVESAKAATK